MAVASPPETAPPLPGYPVIDDISYAGNSEAQAQWRAVGGTAPVGVVSVGNRRVLKLSCNQKGAHIVRASWDRSLKLDLSGRKGIQFRFFCADTDPISHFSCYLKSGKGWYAREFSLYTNGWNTIRIPKIQTNVEGAPAGWGQISMIRISVWRRTNQNTEIYLADLGLLGKEGSIAIIRGESVGEKSYTELKAVLQYTQTVATYLDGLGLSYTVISDRDVSSEWLKKKKIVILPYNPAMPDKVADQLVQFLKEGGKLVACYTLPRKLRQATGIGNGPFVRQKTPGDFASIRGSGEPLKDAPAVTGQMSWNLDGAKAIAGRSRVAAWWHDKDGHQTGHAAIVVSRQCVFMTHVLLTDDPHNKQQLLLASLGELDPDYWEISVKAAIDKIGHFGHFTDFQNAADGILQLASVEHASQPARRKTGVATLLTESRQLRARAIRLSSTDDYPGALTAAEEAGERLLHAYCLAQQPLASEFRAVWCHSGFGVDGMTWDAAVKNLADNGFTAILPNMLWGGTAYYHSSVLPVAQEVETRGDQIKQCVTACRKYGIECHVWKVNWNMGQRASNEFVARMKTAGRTQVAFDGHAMDTWLCPSHPDNQQLEIDSMLEVARKYDVDGLQFDYIRYPGRQSCFCEGCRKRFQEWGNLTVDDWPKAIRSDADLLTKWNNFRRSNITKVVETVSREARKFKPEIKLSAAVFINWGQVISHFGVLW